MSIISTILTKIAAAIASLSMLLGFTHPVPAAPLPVVPLPGMSSSTNAAGLVPSAIQSSSAVSSSGRFSDKNWAVTFNLRPEWNVHEIFGADNTLHQMEISGSSQIIFISKNEGIGLSSDLKYTTATRTIAGQNVTVQTYASPDTTFAYYQLFTLKEGTDTYSFLLKSTTADTTITEAFIASLAKK